MVSTLGSRTLLALFSWCSRYWLCSSRSQTRSADCMRPQRLHSNVSALACACVCLRCKIFLNCTCAHQRPSLALVRGPWRVAARRAGQRAAPASIGGCAEAIPMCRTPVGGCRPVHQDGGSPHRKPPTGTGSTRSRLPRQSHQARRSRLPRSQLSSRRRLQRSAGKTSVQAMRKSRPRKRSAINSRPPGRLRKMTGASATSADEADTK